MNLRKFKLYTAEDFILDEYFRKIVRESCVSDRLKKIEENLPEKRDEINLAVQVLHGLYVEKFHQHAKRKQETWRYIVKTQKRRVIFSYLKIAASLLLMIGIGSAIFYLSTNKKIDYVVSAVELPSKNASLILADGKTISINSTQSTVKYSTDGSGIMVNDTSGIAQQVSANGLNQMIVPYGKRSCIMLSDGSIVWLNSGSKLVFPPVFKGKTREVYLEGEALFDIAKNAEKPFYVKTEMFKMKVYGTRFNVQAYKQDKDCNIVLIEGKVSMNVNDHELKEVFLAPSQKASLAKGQEQFEITNVENTDIYTAWVDGYLTFTNEEISIVLKRVSRYYNVEIIADLPENTEKIYGKLDLKDDLERVLDGIAFISETKYEIQRNKYVFMSN
ncbi:MAG: FecR family protein [Prolixibacteraceae bacterium]